MAKKSKIQIFTFSVLMIVSSSCLEMFGKRDFPEVQSLNKKNTLFVPTLENSISENKNVVYAAAMLYAWDDLRKQFKKPIQTNNSNSLDIILLNNSKSYKNTLLESEFSAESRIIDDVIETEAYFKKSLPFETKFDRLKKPLVFNSTKVQAFGMSYLNENVTKGTSILYYKNDNQFIIKITPRDKNHEIILAKGLAINKTFTDILDKIKLLSDKGKKEAGNTKTQWKYFFNEEDELAIPIISFNLETDYDNLVGQKFRADKLHTITKAYQRTAFLLDEFGAEVESEVELNTDSMGDETIKILPKKLFFDKPFVVFLKRKESKFPYFAMKIENPEFMKKTN